MDDLVIEEHQAPVSNEHVFRAVVSMDQRDDVCLGLPDELATGTPRLQGLSARVYE